MRTPTPPKYKCTALTSDGTPCKINISQYPCRFHGTLPPGSPMDISPSPKSPKKSSKKSSGSPSFGQFGSGEPFFAPGFQKFSPTTKFFGTPPGRNARFTDQSSSSERHGSPKPKPSPKPSPKPKPAPKPNLKSAARTAPVKLSKYPTCSRYKNQYNLPYITWAERFKRQRNEKGKKVHNVYIWSTIDKIWYLAHWIDRTGKDSSYQRQPNFRDC